MATETRNRWSTVRGILAEETEREWPEAHVSEVARMALPVWYREWSDELVRDQVLRWHERILAREDS